MTLFENFHNNVLTGLTVFFNGFFDSLKPTYSFQLIWKSSKVKKIISLCGLFNFLIFSFNIYYTYFVAVWYPNVWNWFSIIYSIFWVFPTFVASTFLNSYWNGELVKLVCKEKYGEPKNQYGYIETIYGSFLIYIFHLLLFLVQVGFSVPVVKQLIIFMGYSWVSAFYLFETRLIYKGFPLPQRIEFLQRRWLYFLGYGTPLALMYLLLPYNMVYSLCYIISDLMVLNTIHLVPQKYEAMVSLPVFGVVQTFSDWLTRTFTLKTLDQI